MACKGVYEYDDDDDDDGDDGDDDDEDDEDDDGGDDDDDDDNDDDDNVCLLIVYVQEKAQPEINLLSHLNQPNVWRQLLSNALSALVKISVVPEVSDRTTTRMGWLGNSMLGLTLLMSGSAHDLYVPL